MKKGLGRGLLDLMKDDERPVNSSLLQGNGTNITIIPLSNIKPNPNQPRTIYDQKELQELANSIKENGVLQPVIVRRKRGTGNMFEIIAGERRFRAAELAEVGSLPSIIKDISDEDAMIIALIENLQREDMNAIDTANGVNSLIQTHGYSHEEVARFLGKSRSYVTNLLRLLKLAPDLQEKLKNREISASVARTIVSIPDIEKVKELLENDNVTVKDIQKFTKPKKVRLQNSKETTVLRMEMDLTHHLKVPATISYKRNGKYEIILKINSIEKLKELVYYHLIKGV
ncbi:MAG: ParB/RepB/Spo0J family partition protein [Rickettsiales bacterium]|jgi:ParB family chromosome partitioning protein|nr:ParB/RepB/Spo0J family partition protein [Rickettsiales bacterium]